MAKPRILGQSDVASLWQLYANFLRCARSLIGRQGVEFNPGNLNENLFVTLKGNTRISVETKKNCGMWFLGLPRKKGNKSDVIEVCLSFLQEIAPSSEADRLILRSCVRVSYFEQKRPSKYKILESWHFDFAPDKAGHPVFHAQLTEDHEPASIPKVQYRPLHRVPDLKDVPRVPTAPLDLAAVMEIIVADHLDEYSEITDSHDWRETSSRLPKLPLTHLASWNVKVDKLKARHWYPRYTSP